VSRFLLVNNQLINFEHVVHAEFEPSHPGGIWSDEDQEMSNPRHARLELTMTSLQLTTYSEGLNEIHLVAASKSQVITLYALDAEAVWTYLKGVATDAIFRMTHPL